MYTLFVAQVLCTRLQILSDVGLLHMKHSINFLAWSNYLGIFTIALFLYKAIMGKYH